MAIFGSKSDFGDVVWLNSKLMVFKPGIDLGEDLLSYN